MVPHSPEYIYCLFRCVRNVRLAVANAIFYSFRLNTELGAVGVMLASPCQCNKSLCMKMDANYFYFPLHSMRVLGILLHFYCQHRTERIYESVVAQTAAASSINFMGMQAIYRVEKKRAPANAECAGERNAQSRISCNSVLFVFILLWVVSVRFSCHLQQCTWSTKCFVIITNLKALK